MDCDGGWIRTRPSRTTSIAGRRELVHAHEPLQRDERLDALAGALAVGHGVDVLVARADEALLLEVGDDALAGVEHRQARVALARLRGHEPVLADDADALEAVAVADLEVVGVVAGRDLQRARAEVRLDVVVGDDRQAPPDERQDELLADEVRRSARRRGARRPRCRRAASPGARSR